MSVLNAVPLEVHRSTDTDPNWYWADADIDTEVQERVFLVAFL